MLKRYLDSFSAYYIITCVNIILYEYLTLIVQIF